MKILIQNKRWEYKNFVLKEQDADRANNFFL
jgi:hypothetical protein